MLVKVKDILEGEKQTEIEREVKSVENLFEDTTDIVGFLTPLSLKCSFMRCGTEIILNASYKVQLKLNCVNCTDDFLYGLDTSFRYVFRFKPEETGPEEQELQRDDLEIAYYEGENIDLRSIVREQIYLNLPQYPRCKEDCLGLCTSCGANLNKEPCKCLLENKKKPSPFSVLKKLKDDK